jgi:hypothetical protein
MALFKKDWLKRINVHLRRYIDMTKFKDIVEYQRNKIAAEVWAKEVKSVDCHSLNSLWYSEGRSDGLVEDIQYNDGSVKRTIRSTGEVIMLNMENVVSGKELVNAFIRDGI